MKLAYKIEDIDNGKNTRIVVFHEIGLGFNVVHLFGNKKVYDKIAGLIILQLLGENFEEQKCMNELWANALSVSPPVDCMLRSGSVWDKMGKRRSVKR